MTEKKPTGLDLLRVPFPEHHISKLPKPTKAQTDEVRNNFKAGVRCTECGGWHHPKVVHLDYVGHASLTDRLLDADVNWHWEPLALTEQGLPLFDQIGGLWIKLTVCGQTRLGYGDAEGKKGGNAVKEAIGDALRNAAMRFGAALDLWHKGDLHGTDEPEVDAQSDRPAQTKSTTITDEQRDEIQTIASAAGVDLGAICDGYKVASLKDIPADKHAAIIKRLKATIQANKKEQ